MAKSVAAKVQNVSDILSSLNTGKSKKESKSRHTIIEEAKVLPLVEACIEAKKALNDAKVNFDLAQDPVVERARLYFEKNEGKEKSVKLKGTSGDTLMVTFKDAFSDIDIEEKEALKESLGDKFDNYFEEKRVITMKETSDEDITILLEALEPEVFQRLFEVKLAIAPVEEMVTKQFTLPKDIRENYVKQHKPAVKL